MMAGTYLRWLIPGLITVLGGAGLAATLTEAPLATDLATRATAALGGDYAWANVTVDGRDIVLSGTATTQQTIDEAVTRIASIRGVRAVDSQTILAEVVSPFPFSATLSGGTTTFEGGYPDENAHTALVANASSPVDHTRMLSGAPETFVAGAKFGLDALKQFDQGEIHLSDTTLTISGRAKSPEALETLSTFGTKVPAGIKLAAIDVLPPLASPYIWTATFDGKSMSINGNTPTTDLANQLLAAVPAGVALTTNLRLASGEPSGFAANTLVLLKSLLMLEGGEAKISDAVITLSGAPATAEVANEVTTAVGGVGGILTLAPPRVTTYALTIDKTGKSIAFSGFVPDSQTRETLSEQTGADVTKLALGRGAPDGLQSALDFGLAALSHLDNGQFALTADKLSLSGSATTVADFKALTDMVAKGAPQGFALASADLHPPVADPYVWSATKTADGTTLAGFVPDETVRAALVASVPSLSADNADPGEGAPADFAASATKGLGVLALLDTGTLKFDGETWSIDGFVDTTEKSFRADATYAAAALAAAGWSYTIHLPEAPARVSLPIIAPYAWRARKALDGTISFTGFAPAEAFQKVAKGRVPGVLDSTVLGAGAPTDFATSALAGIDALKRLDEGSLALAGTRWTLSGAVATRTDRDAIQNALATHIEAANWQIAIQARDAAPVVTPYLWSATKAADGSIELGGYLPDADLQAESAKLAGTVARDTTAIASGEPAGFADDVRAALAALGHLSDGKAMFDGSRWVLSGRVDTQADGEAAIAALAAGSKGGALWTTALSGYVALPPASASSEPAVSSEPSSSSEASIEPSSSSSIEPSSESSSSSAEVSSSSSSEMLSSSEPVSSSSSVEMSSSLESSSSSSSVSEPSSSSESSPSSLESSSSESSVVSSSSESSSMEPSSAALESSSSSMAEPSSSAEAMSSSSQAVSSSELSSSSSASVEPSVASSSIEPSSSAPEASSSASSSSEEPETDRSLEVTEPMPDSLVFEAVRAPNSPIALKGKVPADAAKTYFGSIAGDVPTDGLIVGTGLPDDFITNALAGIDVLGRINEGRVGFDGSRWYLRGKVEGKAVKDAVSATIAALPGGSGDDWDIGLTLLSPLDVCRNRVGTLEKRNVILFQSGSATLTDASGAAIDELASDLAMCPDSDVHVEGHTDSDGDEDVNLVLSVMRAEAVVAALVERGVAEDRLYAEGYGESEPIASNDTKDGKQLNRRIAFTIEPR